MNKNYIKIFPENLKGFFLKERCILSAVVLLLTGGILADTFPRGVKEHERVGEHMPELGMFSSCSSAGVCVWWWWWWGGGNASKHLFYLLRKISWKFRTVTY